MRIKILFVFLLGAVLTFANDSLPALAQGNERLSTLEIQLWPEFDDPRVLVQIDGQVAGAETFSGDMSLWIPSAADLHATAYTDEKGTLVNTDPPQKVDAGDGYTRLTFKLPSARFHVEYYYNPLQGTPDKKMEFVYKAAQPADKVAVIVQQPLKATNFVTVPPATSELTGMHDFKYSRIEFPALAADQLLNVSVNYTKSDPNPSVASITTAPVAAPEPAAPAVDLVPYGVGAGVVALVAVGATVWWFRRRAALNRGPRQRGAKTPAGKWFCTQCGRALREADNFCPRCGHPRQA